MLVYILGRPHSGSTILDIMLANTPEIEGVGELVSGLGRPDDPCSCGVRIGSCPFWRRVRAIVEARGVDWPELVAASADQAHVRHFFRTARAAADDPALVRLATLTRALVEAIAEASGKPHALDSSKEPTRALFLARYVPESKIIHIVRDPEQSVASHYWRWKSKGYFRFLRRNYRHRPFGGLFMVLAAVNWTIGNILADVAVRRAGSRALRIRYEDLRQSPEHVLTRIGQFLGVDTSPVIRMLAKGEPLTVHHNVSGNQIRLSGQITFDPEKERRRPALPMWLRMVTLIICRPFDRLWFRSQMDVIDPAVLPAELPTRR